MVKAKINIDSLIDIVKNGGIIKTGVDIYNKQGLLLLEKNVPVNNVKPLLVIKKCGITDLPINLSGEGGLWDQSGNPISFELTDETEDAEGRDGGVSDVEKRLHKITELRKLATEKYQSAKNNIKKVLSDIQDTGGEFDYQEVEETVSELIDFISLEETAFSYLTREIFSYDDYLYNHSVNVCTIGTVVLKRFNTHFGSMIGNQLAGFPEVFNDETEKKMDTFIFYQPEEIQEMALGYFLHDVGKVLIPDKILNKKGKLTDEEFEIVKQHSYVKGIEILKKNRIEYNLYIKNIVKYHHSNIYKGEERCYPHDKSYEEIPPYVKICKLSDIYDAMTSKRSYKEALSPISVVTDIFRNYAEKDGLLQFVLHSFVKTIGIFPPGSVTRMINGQMIYILDSDGPIVIPFTDTTGKPLSHHPEPFNLKDEEQHDESMRIDRRESLISPVEAYKILPDYLKESVLPDVTRDNQV